MTRRTIFNDLFEEIKRVIIGQDELIEQILIAMLCDSNALIEGYPGLAKTLTVKTIAEAMDLRFSRIQNTPDLMPSDITGTYIIEESGGKREFKFQPGPVFANIVLADEINRATPKTQSALLEAMQEKQVTAGTSTFKLDLPFFVLATQNPIEQEGSLAPDQQAFVNGTLKTGRELLELANGNCISEDTKGIKLYDMDAWTLSLNQQGALEKRKCLLYTLPYTDEMITVTTKTGKKLTVTKNHPFMVNEQGIITWKKAEELTKQDYLVNPARILPPEPMALMSHQAAIRQMKQKKVPVEIPFDNDFAFWSAFLLSDGSIGEKCVEAVQKNYPEALDRFISISQKYGFKPSVRIRNGCRHARIYSKPLIEYLRIRFGIKGGKNKGIPSWFLSLPAEMNQEFLKTFIPLESSIRDNRIVFTQKNPGNVNIISYMLLREGILSWIRHDGRVFRLKIQGKDLINFIRRIGWLSNEKIKEINLDKTVKSSFRVIPVSRAPILKIVKLLGLNSFHTLKGRTDITARPWYGSYKGIKEGETVMSVDSLQAFASDISNEITLRKTPEFKELSETNPRRFAASIGMPMTEISKQLNISKNQVWNLYTDGTTLYQPQIKELLTQHHAACLQEAEKILKYCQALLSADIYYDKIKSIEYTPSEGMAFGLTVPELQNYIAGFGGCGINHNTYPLPEAQADRFLLKIKVSYPEYKDELEIVDRFTRKHEPKLRVVLTKQQLLNLQDLTKQVPIATDIKQRAVKIVAATRVNKNVIEYGASPRASIGMVLAAKARALINGRNYVSVEDIKAMAQPVMRHRIILNFEAERKGMTTDDAIQQIVDKVK